jgi:hypothetical protein
MLVNKRLIFTAVLMVLIFVVFQCTTEWTGVPVVVVTDTDYTSDPDAVPYTDIHDEFAEHYSGADLSIELRNEMISSMQEQALELGENAGTLYHCIKATYTDWDERPMRIPCYAEKCIYEDKAIWAIAFNRANSFDEESLEHFDLFFVTISTHEIVYQTGCF